MTAAAHRFDDPAVLADDVAGRPGPLFAAFDVDGVLAPIVSHSADASLLPGVLDALIALADHAPVGVVSGRAVENLERFGFPESFLVAGSHGAERRGVPLAPLSAPERQRLDRLQALAKRAAADAGPGAWVETKPTSAVLHVREANAERGAAALENLARLAALVNGAHVRSGHAVVELAARPATKAAAIAAMRLDLPPGRVLFVGDDLTDEDVFVSLTPGDVGVRVGPGPTAATKRLRDPRDVLTLVRRLVERLP
jgi:trehalose 6-phosphate phosphatase